MKRTLCSAGRWLVVLACLSPTVKAADEADLNVLGPDVNGVPTRKLLNAYLQAEAKKHFDARRQAVELVKDEAALRKRGEELRAKFVEALGGFPERTPLNAKVVGVIEREGYRIERVVYESRPAHHVTANLYLPAGKGPFPAVLMPCGHSAAGKADGSYQRMAALLARNGIAAMPYDPIGQAERRQVLDAQGAAAVKSMTAEHSLVGVSALLVGECTASYRVWDGIRSLDYLASRPEIDPKRLGCTGVSGGGTLTSYLMALDERVAAAAPSCYVTSLERLFATIGPQDAEQNVPGQVAFGMEHADYLTMRFPRPTLVCAATRDFFVIDGTWVSFREAKRLFTIAAKPELLDILEADAGHGYPKAHREPIARFMSRWLLGRDAAITEPADMAVLPERELWCTGTGQVLTEFKGRSVPELIAAQADRLAGERAATRQKGGNEAITADVRRLLALPDVTAKAWRRQPQDFRRVRRDTYVMQKVIYETETGVFVPGLRFTPDNVDGDKPLVLYVDGLGKSAAAGPDGPVERLVKGGRQVLALDLRGFGETSPGKPPALAAQAGTFGADFSESFLAMHLRRPLLGQRMSDLLSVIETEAADAAAARFELVGIGAAGPAALHAAVLDPRVAALTLDGVLDSWDAVARTPHQRNQLTNVVPGVLRHYDLPDLRAALAPRLTVRNPTDPDGREANRQ